MTAFSSTLGSTVVAIDDYRPSSGMHPQGLNGAHAQPAAPATRNEPTFETDASAVVRHGPIVTSFKRIGLAIRDPRCGRHHLRVLYAFMEKLNQRTGTAFPSGRRARGDGA